MRTTCKSGKTDHVPLYFRIFDFSPPLNLQWNNQSGRAESWLSMGLDDILYIESPLIKDGFGGLGGNRLQVYDDYNVSRSK
ncbi:hypothetical protein LCGC14_2163500 [marine sediment metagenome]|uniref:Uncharacterized protein n=1 Tax=marine sediment metagenome TaxID=412755 RepID=A0A0F9G4R8_9ZZZZ